MTSSRWLISSTKFRYLSTSKHREEITVFAVKWRFCAWLWKSWWQVMPPQTIRYCWKLYLVSLQWLHMNITIDPLDWLLKNANNAENVSIARRHHDAWIFEHVFPKQIVCQSVSNCLLCRSLRYDINELSDGQFCREANVQWYNLILVKMLIHWDLDKWSPFCSRHFQIHFLVWKLFIFCWKFH